MGGFGGVEYVRLLEFLHDSGKKKVKWSTWTFSVFGDIGFAASLSEWKDFDSFLGIFEKAVTDSTSRLRIGFMSKPNLWATEGHDTGEVNVEDYVKEIYSLRIACNKLKSIETVISIYDNSLPADIQGIYFTILKALHERLLSGYELEISTDLKTKDLPEYLLRFIAYDVWKECIRDLKENIIPRLNELQRHMLEVI